MLPVYLNTTPDEQDPSVLINTISELELKLREKDAAGGRNEKEIQILKSEKERLRLVVNATCIYTADVEETTL